MRRWTATLFAVLLGCALLAGCADDGDTASLPAAGEATEETTDGATDEEQPMTEVQQQAVADLAQRLDVDEAEIEVVSVEDVTWSDGSLGCPEPGKMYTQAMVDGQRTVLAHGGEEYAYHSGGDRAPFYCEDPAPAGE